MTIGIVFYSRTGNTRTAAQLLAEQLKERHRDVKLIELQVEKQPGFFAAGYAAKRDKEIPITNPDLDLREFDTLFIGCPVWVGKPSPVIKAFYKKATNGRGKKTGLFVTSGNPYESQTQVAYLMRDYAIAAGFAPVDAFLSLQMMTGEIKDGAQILPHYLDVVLSD